MAVQDWHTAFDFFWYLAKNSDCHLPEEIDRKWNDFIALVDLPCARLQVYGLIRFIGSIHGGRLMLGRFLHGVHIVVRSVRRPASKL